MTFTGVMAMFIGACVVALAIALDPSVEAGGLYDRVNNIGLLNMKEMLVEAGAALFVSGSVMLAAGYVVDALQRLAPQAAPADPQGVAPDKA